MSHPRVEGRDIVNTLHLPLDVVNSCLQSTNFDCVILLRIT